MNLLPTTVNFTGVVAAAVVVFVYGWLWYGPLFGKLWMELSESKAMNDKSKMTQNMVFAFVMGLLTSYVFAVLLGATSATTLSSALTVGFWAWLGFAVPFSIGKTLWGGKSWNLFYLDAAHDLIGFLLITGVLSYLH